MSPTLAPQGPRPPSAEHPWAGPRLPLWALAALAAVSAVGAIACGTEARGLLDLDAYERPGSSCVEVVHASLELGGHIFAVVADSTTPSDVDAKVSTGLWALVERDDLESPGLALIRVPAEGDVEPPAPIPLELEPKHAAAVELRAGLDPGELWVLAPTDSGAQLLHLDPHVGVLASNGALGSFPATGVQPPCPTSFNRVLLLAEGRPYVLAAPDCSPSSVLVLHLLAIEADSLAFGISWEMEFDPCVGIDDPHLCALASSYSVPELEPPRTSLELDARRVPIGLTLLRSLTTSELGDSGLESHDVSLLDIDIDSTGPDARLVTFRDVWDDAPTKELGPPRVGRDPYSTQFQVRNHALAGDAALFRFDTTLNRYDTVAGDALPFSGAGELVPLASHSAIIHVDVERGALEAASLTELDAWSGSWQPVELLRLDGLVSAEQAGLGTLMLRREQAAPQLIAVDCL